MAGGLPAEQPQGCWGPRTALGGRALGGPQNISSLKSIISQTERYQFLKREPSPEVCLKFFEDFHLVVLPLSVASGHPRWSRVRMRKQEIHVSIQA